MSYLPHMGADEDVPPRPPMQDPMPELKQAMKASMIGLGVVAAIGFGTMFVFDLIDDRRVRKMYSGRGSRT